MKFKDDFDTNSRRRHRPHSSHSQTPYLGTNALQGVPLQCQFCSGQTFRRSTLRADDFYQMFLMRYPVRCLRCSQRQMVSFAVAGISLLQDQTQAHRPQHRRSLGRTHQRKHHTNLRAAGNHPQPVAPPALLPKHRQALIVPRTMPGS